MTNLTSFIDPVTFNEPLVSYENNKPYFEALLAPNPKAVIYAAYLGNNQFAVDVDESSVPIQEALGRLAEIAQQRSPKEIVPVFIIDKDKLDLGTSPPKIKLRLRESIAQRI